MPFRSVPGARRTGGGGRRGRRATHDYDDWWQTICHQLSTERPREPPRSGAVCPLEPGRAGEPERRVAYRRETERHEHRHSRERAGIVHESTSVTPPPPNAPAPVVNA